MSVHRIDDNQPIEDGWKNTILILHSEDNDGIMIRTVDDNETSDDDAVIWLDKETALKTAKHILEVLE